MTTHKQGGGVGEGLGAMPTARAGGLAPSTRFAVFAVPALIAIAGCGSEQRHYFQHPEDPEVRSQVFRDCLRDTRPPSATHYNDQDETVAECGRQASDAARYCPEGAADCGPQYGPRQEVRRILAKSEAAQ